MNRKEAISKITEVPRITKIIKKKRKNFRHILSFTKLIRMISYQRKSWVRFPSKLEVNEVLSFIYSPSYIYSYNCYFL